MFGVIRGNLFIYQNQLKKDIQSEELDDVSEKRILFWGPVNAGKSSVINSFASVDNARPANVAVSSGGHTSSHSMTKKLHIVVLSERMKNIRLLDIMGLENGTLDGFNPDDVKCLLEGNLKHGFPFDPKGVPNENKGDLFIANPTLAEMAHCNVLVIAAKNVDQKILPKEMLQKLNAVCHHSHENGVATIVLLTHIEDVCNKVAKDVKDVFSSPKIKEVVDTAHELFGVRKMDIFPIKNYTDEPELNTPMNILLLLALRQIVWYAADRIRNIARNRE